ncbi:hypothetical protein [Rugosimonospora africana]|uniref:Uncharacterized protein n=1 Tax=Rugosimonospora africana TaxID=556532 RepID=A0A8J3QSM8_9ACTN|nr:hypothetical protein [Rugosimonospora africana]GIH16129.1 hypothetical protein Raf01_43010 [Rugosimonospora africana]
MDLPELIGDIKRLLDPIFDAMSVAEDEISAAQQRHPDAADRIWRSFPLLRPTDGLTTNNLVYRAHCRELLDRVAAGANTKPGTAAECCWALCEVSQRVPLNTTAAGLYSRMWRLAGLPPVNLADNGGHYEALAGGQIDDYEAVLRQRLRQDWRALSR